MKEFNDNYLTSPLILQRLILESENTEGVLTGYWAVMVKANGDQFIIKNGVRRQPDAMQQIFARDMARGLNRAIRHDGAWIVFWTHPEFDDWGPGTSDGDTVDFRQWHFVWIDEDGDPGFTIDNEDPFHMVLLNGADHWLDQAETAWQNWRLMMKDVLAPSEGQIYKRAQGQDPGSVNGRKI